MSVGQCDHEITVRVGRDIGRQQQAAVRHARERYDDAFDVGGILDRTGHELDRQRRCRSLGRP